MLSAVDVKVFAATSEEDKTLNLCLLRLGKVMIKSSVMWQCPCSDPPVPSHTLVLMCVTPGLGACHSLRVTVTRSSAFVSHLLGKPANTAVVCPYGLLCVFIWPEMSSLREKAWRCPCSLLLGLSGVNGNALALISFVIWYDLVTPFVKRTLKQSSLLNYLLNLSL